jgi:glycosyltransferase involved in cell wall biosynthesis
MKIYLDDGFASQHGGGIAAYTHLIYSELKKRNYDVTYDNYHLLKMISNRSVRRILYCLYVSLILPFYLKKHRYDIAHFTNHFIPPLKNNYTKYIATIHDLGHIIFPETVSLIYYKYFRGALKIIIKNSDCIITPSRSAKDDLKRIFNVDDKKIKVCGEASKYTFDKSPPTNHILKKYSIEAKEYFLFVGRLEKRKNIVTLVKAFDRFKEETKTNKKLVLVGNQGFGFYEIQDTINNSTCKDDIIITGYISNQDLQELYHNASAFVFPSIIEGFGLPILEAMHFELPLILSNIPTNLELTDSRGSFFDPENLKELKDLLKRVENKEIEPLDYSDALKKYSLDAMIDSHLEVYEHMRRKV